jgi:nitrous oxidase accessory protein
VPTRLILRGGVPAVQVFLTAGLLGLALAFVHPSAAAVLDVAPDGDSLVRAVAMAAPGDVLRLRPGRHRGPVILDRAISILGSPGTVIDGGGKGRVMTIAAPGVFVRGLTIANSGDSLAKEDSGIFVTSEGDGAVIENNRLESNLIGVYLKGPERAIVKGNVILGRRDLRMNERGNGIQIWNAPGSVAEDNDIRFGRDGIFVTTSKNNTFRGNCIRDLRIAIHYMYTNRSEVSGNVSTGNHVGYAIMYSRAVTLRGNVSDGDRDRGLFFNFTNGSRVEENEVRGADKCVFVYNANKNSFRGNTFQECGIGIHFTAGSERNEISGNAFMNNRTQVKYVGTRQIEWSFRGRGNYWSDNASFDLDGDGIADRPYRPNGMFDQVVWRTPVAKLLVNSPAVQVLRWAQTQFPALLPGGVTDSAPLMRPPPAQQSGEG